MDGASARIGAAWIPAASAARLRALCAALLATALLLGASGTAHAAEQYYTTKFECGGGRGSGQVDQYGFLYVPCTTDGGVARPNIKVYDAEGARRQVIYTATYVTDVAPSPDGSYLYVVGPPDKTPHRMTRTATGAYVADAAWKVDDYPQWGTDYKPLGEFLATDAAGNLYVSSGTWTNAPASIIKYGPDGKLITQFGAWENSWATGIFYWMNAGVTVTPDGSKIYVAEVGNNRIQRFDRQEDGSYAYAWKLGNDPDADEDARTGWCGEDVRPGRFAAPYDVGLDEAGNIYVLNTSCVQVRKFAPDGTHLHTEQLNNPRGGYTHGFAIDRSGRVYVPEVATVMNPGVAPEPEPTYTWITEAHAGWAYATAKAPATIVPAWKWTANGWQYVTTPSRTQVWVQPFAVGWKWAWFDGAWHAMRTGDIAL